MLNFAFKDACDRGSRPAPHPAPCRRMLWRPKTMAIQIALNHKTQYRYDRRVSLGPQVVRLRPAPHCRTPILTYSLKIHPKNHFLNWQQDPQANYLARLVFPEPTTEFLVEVDLVAEMAVFNPFDFFLEPDAEKCPFYVRPRSPANCARSSKPNRLTPALGLAFHRFAREPIRTIDFLIDLNQRLRNEIGYVIRMEPGIQSCEQTLALATGSCRDTAWLLVQILRHLGLAARFVSGYLIQLTADLKPLEGPAGPAADFTDLHAWTEVYLPGAGWIGLDPTSGLLAGEGHIPLACTPDASSAAPISGLLDPCKTEFHHEMSVGRVYESPRVTKPYSERAMATKSSPGPSGGCRIDRRRRPPDHGRRADLRLSRRRRLPEWTISALGPNKRKLVDGSVPANCATVSPPARCSISDKASGIPANRCRAGPWAVTGAKTAFPSGRINPCSRHEQGLPLKRREQRPPFSRSPHAAARSRPAFIMSAYEDIFYYLWRERRLPVNVDPLDSKIKDPVERARMARIFEQELGQDHRLRASSAPRPDRSGAPHWTSRPGSLASPQLFLVPGDSPLGLRLPLESLPWTKPEDVE